MNIFVTSTASGAGKTLFSTGIAAVMQSLGYEMGVYKPIQTGCKFAENKQCSPDLNFVKKIDPNIKTYSTYNFKQNIVPSVAAEAQRIVISPDKIAAQYNEAKKDNDILIVEGTGGIWTPVYNKTVIADIIRTLKIPVIIVAEIEIDMLNNLMLTVKAAEAYDLSVLGIVLNRYKEDNYCHGMISMIENLTGYPVLGQLPEMKFKNNMVNPENLISETIQNVNLSKVFAMEIPKLAF